MDIWAEIKDTNQWQQSLCVWKIMLLHWSFHCCWFFHVVRVPAGIQTKPFSWRQNENRKSFRGRWARSHRSEFDDRKKWFWRWARSVTFYWKNQSGEKLLIGCCLNWFWPSYFLTPRTGFRCVGENGGSLLGMGDCRGCWMLLHPQHGDGFLKLLPISQECTVSFCTSAASAEC